MARKLSQCPDLGRVRTTYLQPSRDILQVSQDSRMAKMYCFALSALSYAGQSISQAIHQGWTVRWLNLL